MSKDKLQWHDLSPMRKACIIVAALIQISLAIGAWVDLARRPKEQVRGRKALWIPVIAVNFVGPLTYFGWGRRKHVEPDELAAE